MCNKERRWFEAKGSGISRPWHPHLPMELPSVPQSVRAAETKLQQTQLRLLEHQPKAVGHLRQ